LWRTHPALVTSSSWISQDSNSADSDDGQGLLLNEINGNSFASLVHPNLHLYAELDILVLRPENPGALISHSGDIDNQLKTLFDALRRPVDASEIPSAWSPAEDERPLHCLLDDDKLITRVSVDTDRLLVPEVDPKEVHVTIRVSIKGTSATWGNLVLIG
jgi:hypothetical protein